MRICSAAGFGYNLPDEKGQKLRLTLLIEPDVILIFFKNLPDNMADSILVGNLHQPFSGDNL